MKIVFFGTTRFSAYILESLLQNKNLCSISAVVTRPDRPAGRSLQLRECEVKQYLKNHPEIPIHQPEKVSTADSEALLKAYNADLFVVVAFGEIIKQNILNLPPLGCFNIHASLLPKYRGAAPIQRAIMEGEHETGITIIKMVLKMDAGPIVLMQKVTIDPQDDFLSIEKKLMVAGAECIKKTIEAVKNHSLKEEVQNESLVTFANKIEPKDCIIRWGHPAEKIINQIRALSPSPGAYTHAHIKGENKRVKLLQAKITPHLVVESKVSKRNPGALTQLDGSYCIATADYWIAVERLQMEGKPAMNAKDFFNGVKVDQFQDIDL